MTFYAIGRYTVIDKREKNSFPLSHSYHWYHQFCCLYLFLNVDLLVHFIHYFTATAGCLLSILRSADTLVRRRRRGETSYRGRPINCQVIEWRFIPRRLINGLKSAPVKRKPDELSLNRSYLSNRMLLFPTISRVNKNGRRRSNRGIGQKGRTRDKNRRTPLFSLHSHFLSPNIFNKDR